MQSNAALAALSYPINRLAKSLERNWVPASGGTETPFKSRSGLVLLYCWDSNSGDHAYLDTECDLILSDSEAFAAMGHC